MKLSLFLLIALLFGGCTTKRLPPITKYTIVENSKKIDLQRKLNCKSIKVEFPKSSDEIFSKNIIYQKGLQKNSYYFSKWYETPNYMLYSSILSLLQRDKVCKKVLPEDFNGDTEYVLSINILDFVQKFSNEKSYAKIGVVFYISDKSGNIIAQKLFNESVKCSSNDAIGAVKAFNKTTDKLMQEFIVWLERVL